jgi:hypothetical protein
MLLLVLVLLGAQTLRNQPSLAFPQNEALPITGTFSDLRYNEEGGDVIGTEIRIVVAKKGYQATIQFGEGEPSDLIVVPVHFGFESMRIGEVQKPPKYEAEKVRFDLPEGSDYAGSFEGEVTRKSLSGNFHFARGGKLHVKLPKKRSYWER